METMLQVGKRYKRTTKYGELISIITVNKMTINYHQSLIDSGIIYEEVIS